MEYKELAKINENLKTTPIKGKEYAEVPTRVLAFRQLYPEGVIRTEMLSNANGVCVFVAEVFASHESLKPLSTGHAYEKEGSTFINKISYIENCETSAVGRALGFLGIGIDTSIASYEEVQNAKANQNKKEKAPEPEASMNDVIGEDAGREVMETLIKFKQSPDIWAKKYRVTTLAALTYEQRDQIKAELQELKKGQKNEKA